MASLPARKRRSRTSFAARKTTTSHATPSPSCGKPATTAQQSRTPPPPSRQTRHGPTLRTRRRAPREHRTKPRGLPALAKDQDAGIKEQAFRHLITQQHEPTIRRALATLTRRPTPSSRSPLPRDDRPRLGIGKIKAAFALDDLRRLRRRALGLNSGASQTSSPTQSPTSTRIARQQHPGATPRHAKRRPPALDAGSGRAPTRSTHRGSTATPFDTVIRKLKGATSMIHVKSLVRRRH